MHCIVQARMQSKRLPGKTLKVLGGEPVLMRVIRQIKKSRKIKKIIVATSNKKKDLKIINFCKKNNIEFFRGNHLDVAKRYISAIKKYPCRYFVRICADSPLLDPILIDKMIHISKKKKYEIVTNVFPRSFPKGHTVEVLKSNLLKKFYHKFNYSEKEHLTSFFYKNFRKFKIFNLKSKTNNSKKNFSLDTISDFKRLEKYIGKDL